MSKLFKSAIMSTALSWGWRNRGKLLSKFRGNDPEDRPKDPAYV